MQIIIPCCNETEELALVTVHVFTRMWVYPEAILYWNTMQSLNTLKR